MILVTDALVNVSLLPSALVLVVTIVMVSSDAEDSESSLELEVSSGGVVGSGPDVDSVGCCLVGDGELVVGSGVELLVFGGVVVGVEEGDAVVGSGSGSFVVSV